MKTTQTEKLIHYLRAGNRINFLEAYYKFGIQDIRKRLMEAREEGYRLKMGNERDRGTGRTVHYWELDKPLFNGDFVRVVPVPVHPTGKHPMLGREGVIVGQDGHRYVVGELQSHKPFGKFYHQDLLKVAKYGYKTGVTLRPGAYDIYGYDPQTSNYILREGQELFYAPERMLVVNQTRRTDSRGFIPCK